MKTKQLNVRISDIAFENLAAIRNYSGNSKTAIVEFALAELKARLIPNQADDNRPPVGAPLKG